MDKDKLMQQDLYEMLEISFDSDDQAIKKAYRKKALKCHPDKNPDNPQAAALFLELSLAIEILLGATSRPVYDKLLKARKAAQIRNNLLDEKRKKFKFDLEERERQAQNQSTTGRKNTYADTLKEIDRLRKEASRQLLEEMERLNQEMAQKREETINSYSKDSEEKSIRIKVKWDNADNKTKYDDESLKRIFSKYGTVDFVIIGKKQNSAIIECSNVIDRINSIYLECGFMENPLKINVIGGEKHAAKSKQPNLFPSMSRETTANFPSSQPTKSNLVDEDEDYEQKILNRLRQFEQTRKDKQPL